ncbi:hypothetical protein V2S66_23300 [Streptomyces sp. V4-01]|uniref:SseB protein N-terminal domain-containing protein n=1 Tax=Actinacidiphila polyblastidii TaxID=3110430 RepID=A0ABU7PHT7_9ACTN|nr:hypothetical protein [Streptomyces sp. V4-01]
MSESAEGPVEVTPLVFRIADSTVLIGVRTTERGPEPLFTDVGGEPCAVAYTDPEEISGDLPEGYRLFQIPVPLLLTQLPPGCGLLINPRAASPLLVAAAERDIVLAASVPFPSGAFIAIKSGGDEQPRLLAAALPRIEFTAVRRVYVTRYRVADAREKVLVVYETDPAPGADSLAADGFAAAAAETGLADPMQVVALADVPETFRAILLADVPPAYVRPDLVE